MSSPLDQKGMGESEVGGNAVELPLALKVGLDALEKGDFDHAVAIFDAIGKANSDVPAFFAAQAIALFLNGRVGEAFSALHKGFALDPQYPLLNTVARLMSPWEGCRVVSVASYGEETRAPSTKHSIEIGFEGLPAARVDAYELREVSILGGRGLLTAPRRTIILESTIDGNIDQAMLLVTRAGSKMHAPPIRAGFFMPLYGLWSEGFYHWMIEWLPKVIVAQRLGFDGTYVIPAHRPYIRESLRMLGIADRSIEDFSGNDWSPERTLVVPLGNGSMLLEKKPILHVLRHTLRNAAEASTHSARVYISRANPNRPRRVVNEKDLTEFLAPYGFEVVDMEGLPLRQQVGKVLACSMLIGPTGAGMVHALFMKEHGTIVELFPPTYINPVGTMGAALLRQRYYMVPSYLNAPSYGYGQDIEAYLGPIRLVLERELA